MSSFLGARRRGGAKSTEEGKPSSSAASYAQSLRGKFFGGKSEKAPRGGVVGSDSEDSDFETEHLRESPARGVRPPSRAGADPFRRQSAAAQKGWGDTASGGLHATAGQRGVSAQRHSVNSALQAELEELQGDSALDMRGGGFGGGANGAWGAPQPGQGGGGFGLEGFKVYGNSAFEAPAPSQAGFNSGSRGVGGRGGRGTSSDEEDSPSVMARKRGAGRNPFSAPARNSGPTGANPQLSNTSERGRFLNKPGPQDKMIQCYVKREKDPTGMYPQFTLYLQDGDQFLMCARRRKKSQTSNYIISLDQQDTARKGAAFFGKLRANYVGTQYLLYNTGLKPGKNVQDSEERKELGAILFKPTALDIKGGPRVMTVVVPFPEEFNQQLGLDRSNLGLTGRWKKQKKGEGPVTVIALQNKKPVWDPQSKGYCLDFRGRVTEPSVKNFQLIPVSSDEAHARVVLQFGKCGDDSFALDFSHPLTPFQAFGICLSSVDGKLCYAV